GAGVDLVVHVRDVAYIGYVLGAVERAQQAEQHVEDDHRPRIADMSEVVDSRPAHIHAHIAGIERDEILLAPRQRGIDPEPPECFGHGLYSVSKCTWLAPACWPGRFSYSGLK